MGKSPSKDVDKKYSTELYFEVDEKTLPIVYNDVYNITFGGLEKLHLFDACKWGNIINILTKKGFLKRETIIHPKEASHDDLLFVHTERYLNSLRYSATVAMITEIIPVAMIPNFIVQKRLLKNFRYHVGGTVMAAKAAVERGWAINVGGGFHHCSSDSGGGFCVYADITIAIRMLQRHNNTIKNVMIVDLDAHQGNGHEHDFMNDESVYIMDVYNASIYPGDVKAQQGINRKIELKMYTKDKRYLDLVKIHIEEALDEFQADFILYNAGTDILENDPLGCLSITPGGIIERDQIVFEAAIKRGIPITMVTSGGYQRCTAEVIADSILNLNEKGFIPHSI